MGYRLIAAKRLKMNALLCFLRPCWCLQSWGFLCNYRQIRGQRSEARGRRAEGRFDNPAGIEVAERQRLIEDNSPHLCTLKPMVHGTVRLRPCAAILT
jgi:hypothetical protein